MNKQTNVSSIIVAPPPRAVKLRGNKVLASPALKDSLLNSPETGAAITLPTNLTAQAYLLCHLPTRAFEHGVVWCLASGRDFTRSRLLAEQFWPNAKTKPTFLEFPDDLTSWLEYRGTTPTVLLVAQAHLALALPTPALITARVLAIKTGQTIKPNEVLRALTVAGFEPGPLPDTTGWFAKQGGSIIISTPRQAWRLTWNGDQIERLNPLNLTTGAANQSLAQLRIWPRKLEPDSQTTLEQYLKASGCTLLATPTNLNISGTTAYPLDPLRPSQLFGSVPLFGRQWELLVNYFNEQTAAGKRLVIITCEPRAIAHQLAELPEAPIVTEVNETLAAELEGFCDLTGNTCYLTDRELSGAKRRRPLRNLAAFEHLTAGDYLVHIDHGIGRFDGLVQQTIDDITRDYFLVSYAEDDRLYVPIEHTDRLSRYLGGPHPKLERLHDASWFQTTKKVKAETTALARQLLANYAKRSATTIKPWQHQTEEPILQASFAWPLTPDQLKAWAEISADLDGTTPMDRLICGDVGFGKTELALRASFRAVLNGYQVAVLAPTTILAQQHFDTFSERLKDFKIRLGLASRAQPTAEIRRTLQKLAQGEIDIIIGTHRLLARDVSFKELGLLVVDEEQRFGVRQKEQLRALKPALHMLALSATPIPRTLNLAVSNLRDLSIINTAPVGRQRIVTEFCPSDDATITGAIRQELKRKGQIYFLVHHIRDLAEVEERLHRLVPEASIGVLHGRLAPSVISTTMHRFDQGELQILLATTIIENGLDLPNVNTLIVEGADEFGLSDLYQLRGRVGRSPRQAYAYFLVSDRHTAAADKRLEALAQARDLGQGLTLALKDLELRGAGAILGREQHGHVSAVGLHLYGQLLAQAIEELKSGETMPAIPEVLLRLPLEGRIHPQLIPDEANRIQVYQRLAAIREPTELSATAEELIGRPLGDEPADRLLKNLLTLLELKLLAERARLREASCQVLGTSGRFALRFLEPPLPEVTERLIIFDDRWHKVESTWQAEHPLAAGAWINWLKASLKTLNK